MCKSNTYGNANGDVHSDGNSYSDCHVHAYRNGNSYCDSYSYSNSHGYGNANCDRDAEVYTDAETAAHAGAASDSITLAGAIKTGTREITREFPVCGGPTSLATRNRSSFEEARHSKGEAAKPA